MMERTPKSKCTRNIEQERFVLKFWRLVKICTKVNFLEIGRLHNFRVSIEEMGPKIEMYSKNWVGQVRFEIFDFLVMVKGPLG